MFTSNPPTETSNKLSVEISGGSRILSMDSNTISDATNTKRTAFAYPETTSNLP